MWPSGSKTNLDSLGLGSAKMLVKCVHVRAGGCIILARFNLILWYFNKQKTSVYSNLILLCISFIYFYNFQLMSHQWTFWNLRNMQDFYQRLSSGHKDVVVNVVNTFIFAQKLLINSKLSVSFSSVYILQFDIFGTCADWPFAETQTIPRIQTKAVQRKNRICLPELLMLTYKNDALGLLLSRQLCSSQQRDSLLHKFS